MTSLSPLMSYKPPQSRDRKEDKVILSHLLFRHHSPLIALKVFVFLPSKPVKANCSQNEWSWIVISFK